MSDTGEYCWGRVSLILRSCRGYGHEAPQLLGLVFPQTELQEVLGADEEAGPLDGDETASPGGPEEKEQENSEPPVQTALLTASVPAAQVGSGGVQCAFVHVLCACMSMYNTHGARLA